MSRQRSLPVPDTATHTMTVYSFLRSSPYDQQSFRRTISATDDDLIVRAMVSRGDMCIVGFLTAEEDEYTLPTLVEAF